MFKKNSAIESQIESEFESFLTTCGNEKLLTVDSGIVIDTFLLFHPSPRPLIKKLIQRRRIEDLVLLSLTMPAAAKNMLQSKKTMSEAEGAQRFGQVFKLLTDESVEFSDFIEELSTKQNREALVQLQNACHSLMKAYSEANFDADEYLSQHPDSFSIMMDWYLIYQLISSNADPVVLETGFEKAMNLTWGLRELLSSYRIKNK